MIDYVEEFRKRLEQRIGKTEEETDAEIGILEFQSMDDRQFIVMPVEYLEAQREVLREILQELSTKKGKDGGEHDG